VGEEVSLKLINSEGKLFDARGVMDKRKKMQRAKDREKK